MSKVYVLADDLHAKALTRVRCKDEDKELQRLLQQNPELLPSEQIDPDNPPQWLLIKREMPVSDPATGSERWSIDFLYVDHMAIPTLVECKRCSDTRSRREVVAQMLEYAANGHHYWTAADLQAYAQETAGGEEQLNSWISRFRGPGETATTFFEATVANLRESTMRLVFFLEESPNELRSLVDFLNRQLKATEVLLVEARLYDSPAGRVVVPWLFGYTEEARVAKRESRAQAARTTGAVGAEAFHAAIEGGALSDELKSGVRALLEAWPVDVPDAPCWVFRVNAVFMVPPVMRTRGLFQLGRDGTLSLYFGYWDPGAMGDVTPQQARFKETFAAEIATLLGVQFTEKQLRGFPTIKASQWLGKQQELIALLKKLAGATVVA